MIEMRESGLLFRFEDETFFPIEKEKDKLATCKGHVKTCECVVYPQKGLLCDKVVFIEAKSSAPNRANCIVGKVTHDGTPIDTEHWRLLTPLDNYARDISQKFIDSFSMWHSIDTGFHNASKGLLNIPAGKKTIRSGEHPIFVLVIKGFADDWLAPVKAAIEAELRHFIRAWNIRPTALKVVNESMAREILQIDVETY